MNYYRLANAYIVVGYFHLAKGMSRSEKSQLEGISKLKLPPLKQETTILEIQKMIDVKYRSTK